MEPFQGLVEGNNAGHSLFLYKGILGRGNHSFLGWDLSFSLWTQLARGSVADGVFRAEEAPSMLASQ